LNWAGTLPADKVIGISDAALAHAKAAQTITDLRKAWAGAPAAAAAAAAAAPVVAADDAMALRVARSAVAREARPTDKVPFALH
jgi:hypothetical protein